MPSFTPKASPLQLGAGVAADVRGGGGGVGAGHRLGKLRK